MAMEELPKRILMIKECTFILPDDFEGSLEDAFTEFLEYRRKNLPSAQYADPQGLFSTFNLLMHSKGESKACGEYAIYELKDNKYVMVDGTGPI